ncbi:hypothetical protein CF8_0056 [Aeromonas phage CF8]|nr:hypothetical protein CF8_0056 [Aeromonas phage CF8]
MELKTEIIHTDDICMIVRSGDINTYLVMDQYQNELGTVKFQNGSPVNGVTGMTLEAMIATCIYRLDALNQGQFKCDHNDIALDGLKSALYALNNRAQDRKERGVYDTENA